MKIEDCKKSVKSRSDRPDKHITVRVSRRMSRWLGQNDLSPTAVFRQACNELGFKFEGKNNGKKGS